MVVALSAPVALIYAAACLVLAMSLTSWATRRGGLARLAMMLAAALCGVEAAAALWLAHLPPPDPPDAYLRAEHDPAFAAPWRPTEAPLYDVPLELVDRAGVTRADPAALRVLFLGDSFTAGAGVRRDQAYPAEVGRLLATRGVRAEIVNHAVLGYSTFDEDALFQSWSAAFDPDVVVLGVLINDLDVRGFSAQAGDTQVNELLSPATPWSPRPPLAWATVRHVADMRSVGAQTEAQYHDAWTNPATVASFRAHLRSIAARAAAGGARLLVVRVPLLHALEQDAFPWQAEAVRASAESVGASYVDLYPTVRGLDASTLWVASFDHHPNADAHARMAPGVADAIVALHATPAPSPTVAPDPRSLLQLASSIADPALSTPDCKVRPGVSPTLAQIALANRDMLPESERAAFTAEAMRWSEYPKTRCSP